jgi:peptide/nickel transport system permease protein
MTKYLFARFVLLVPVLIGVSIVTFTLIRLVPGDPVSVILGPDVRVRVEDMAAIRAKYGLDEPPPVQYVRWMGRVLSGDL